MPTTSVPTAARAPAKRQAPRVSIAPSGLCADCASASTCTFPRAASAPVMRCEEAVLPAVAVPSPFGRQSAAPVAASEPTVRGLCVNCDHRDVCTLRKPEGGVWRCEEYA